MPNEPTIKTRRSIEDANIDESSGGIVASIIFKMIFVAAALFVLLQAVQGGVVPAPAVVSAPARFVAAPVSAPLLAAPAPLVAPAPAPFVAAAPARLVAAAPAPLVAAAPAPIVAAAPAPLAIAKTQNIAPFAASVNYVARSPLLPYTVGGPVVSPFVETFSAPLVARKFAPVAAAAPLVAAPAPFVGAAPAPFVGAGVVV